MKSTFFFFAFLIALASLATIDARNHLNRGALRRGSSTERHLEASKGKGKSKKSKSKEKSKGKGSKSEKSKGKGKGETPEKEPEKEPKKEDPPPEKSKGKGSKSEKSKGKGSKSEKSKGKGSKSKKTKGKGSKSKSKDKAARNTPITGADARTAEFLNLISGGAGDGDSSTTDSMGPLMGQARDAALLGMP
jgi:outer membrane biosynthesis protein TonB